MNISNFSYPISPLSSINFSNIFIVIISELYILISSFFLKHCLLTLLFLTYTPLKKPASPLAILAASYCTLSLYSLLPLNLINVYILPTQIITHSGCIIHPTSWLNPYISDQWRSSLHTFILLWLINTSASPLSLLMKILALMMKNNLHIKRII